MILRCQKEMASTIHTSVRVRLDDEFFASESDWALTVWPCSEADGVEGDLQLRRDSKHHARDGLQVIVPPECEQQRKDFLENKAKANVGKT